MPLNISSVIFSKQFPDGGELLDALLALGFDGLELEYRVSAASFAQMAPRLGRDVSVGSVHAFFPNPCNGTGGGANAFLFSSPDRERCEEAVRHGVATLETAARIGARAVVLHLGRVAVDDDLLGIYRRLLAEEATPLDQLRESVGPILDARQRLFRPHLDAVRRAVDRLNREALRRGLLLGLENRFHPHEIPSHEELGLLLREFAGGAVRAWFDSGHAAYQERLGLQPRLAWLEAYGAACAGAHLHDIRGTTDHLPPGTGEEDFAAILRRLPAGALRVLEVRAGTPREELVAGRELLEKLGS